MMGGVGGGGCRNDVLSLSLRSHLIFSMRSSNINVRVRSMAVLKPGARYAERSALMSLVNKNSRKYGPFSKREG